jgi:hypothetical protein
VIAGSKDPELVVLQLAPSDGDFNEVVERFEGVLALAFVIHRMPMRILK